MRISWRRAPPSRALRSRAPGSTPPLPLGGSPRNGGAQGKARRARAGKRTHTKRLDVAIVGLPNAGKSLLLNELIGSKVSAVSRKRHTTRDSILGVAHLGRSEIVFRDHPGLVSAAEKGTVQRSLQRETTAGIGGAQVALVVVDCVRKHQGDAARRLQETLAHALRSGAQLWFVLNKVDLEKNKRNLIPLTDRMAAMAHAAWASLGANGPDGGAGGGGEEEAPHLEVFYTSAKERDGVDELRDELVQASTAAPWMFRRDEVTDMLLEERVREVIREQLYRNLHQELPYSIEQRISVSEEPAGAEAEGDARGGLRVTSTLVAATPSQANILRWSKGGDVLRHMEQRAAEELEKVLERSVALELAVGRPRSR